MSRASFLDVWNLALSVFLREPIFVRVAIGLGIALAIVMCLEGFYASLFPRRYAARLARSYQNDLPPPPSGGRRRSTVQPAESSEEDVAARISALLRNRALQQNRKLQAIPAGALWAVKPRLQRRSLVNASSVPGNRPF